ncbi:MAG TPA: extracellular solute-binding protein [Symbiobacteriaceae bacterium]|jgi:multiple sugar transport system substrate-binding protein
MLRKITVFLCIAALLILTGCSTKPAAEAPKPAEAKQPDPVTITYWHTYSTDSNENKVLNETVIPAFQKKFPYITVKAVVQPYDDLHASATVAIAGGTTPDVLRMDIIWSPEFAKLGALEPLDGYAGFSDVKGSIAFPAPLATNAYKGKYYGMPLDTNTQVMVYNPEFLKAAGLSAPPKSIDDFKKFGAAFTGKDKKYAIALDGMYPWQILPFFWSMGGKVTNDDYTKASGFVNSDDSIAALQVLFDMKKSGALAPSIMGDKPGTWDGYKAGEYGAVLQGPWFFAILGNDLKGKMQGAVVPAGKAGSISVIGGENIGMFKASKNKEAAWKFIQFMLSDEAQVAMAKTGQMPVTKSASANPVMKEAGYYDAYIEQLKNANPRTPVPSWTKIDGVMSVAVESVFRGKATPKAALDQAAKEIDALLAQ